MDENKEVLKDQLYYACQAQLPGDDDAAYEQVFTQEDLQGLDVVPPKDLKTLMGLVQALTNDMLFIPLSTAHGPVWRLRPEKEAAKYRGLTADQKMVYGWIDSAGAEGIWQQTLRNKSGINQDQTFKTILKQLETKRLITHFMSVQHVSHKCWIKASITPSLKATGGPWYTDGDLDESFINILLNVVFNAVKEQGSYYSMGGAGRAGSTSPVLPKKVLKGKESEVALAARGKKRDADAMAADDDGGAVRATSPHKLRKTAHGGVPPHHPQPVRLPLPAGYRRYITLTELTEKIASTNITKGQKLKESDVKQLLDVLIFDDRVEEVVVGRRRGYRVTSVAKHDPSSTFTPGVEQSYERPTNGLTEAPCGRCPVFDLCEAGGPVWPGGCEYFDQWLV